MPHLQHTLSVLTIALVVALLYVTGVASLSVELSEADQLSRQRRSADETENQLNRRERREAAVPVSGVSHSSADGVPLSSADLKHVFAAEEPESDENWAGEEETEENDDGEAMEKRKWGDNKARVWGKRKWGDNRARVWGKRRSMTPAIDDYLEKFEAENRKLTDEAAHSGNERNGGKRKWGENKARIWGKRAAE
jgi:hypothetical protein